MKKRGIFIIAFILLLVGCSKSVFSLSEPPVAVVHVGGKTYDIDVGSYCWDHARNTRCVSKENGQYTIKDKDIIQVKPNAELKIEAKNIKETASTSYNYQQKGSSKYAFEEDKKASGLTIVAPAEEGIYYINQSLQWQGKQNSNGVIPLANASYQYAVEVIK